MSQRVRALFLMFENSPCQPVLGDALRDAQTNGWATQLYCLDSIVTPSFNKHLEDDGATPHCEPGDIPRPRNSICSWLLVRVLQDTIALAEREQAQLFVFCGGYGTSTDTGSLVHGFPSTLAPQQTHYTIIDPFLILDKMADCDRECLVILHTSIPEAQLQRWRQDRQHQPNSGTNVEILLFNEGPSQCRTGDVGEVYGIDYEMEAPQFRQVEKVTKALSHMITSCRFGKLQLKESLLQKLRLLGLHFSSSFTSKAPRLTMEACDNANPTKEPTSEEKYKDVSVLMLAVPTQPISLRLRILSWILLVYGYNITFHFVPEDAGHDATSWAQSTLSHFLKLNDEEDCLLIVFYADDKSTSDDNLPASSSTSSLQTFDFATLDTTLEDCKIKSNVLRVLVRDQDHEDAAADASDKKAKSRVEVKDDYDGRIVELLTENLDRLIGRFIHSADVPFSISELKHDLQEMRPARPDEKKKRSSGRRTAAIRQGKLIVPILPAHESPDQTEVEP